MQLHPTQQLRSPCHCFHYSVYGWNNNGITYIYRWYLQEAAAAVDAVLGNYRPWQIVLLAAGATVLIVTSLQVGP